MYHRSVDIDQVKYLYLTPQLSALEIGNKLGKTVWQVIRFMKKNNIPRRSNNATRRLQFLRSPLSYSKPNKVSYKQKFLQLAGLMLYWAEGSKANKNTVDFANSDKDMAKLFLKMLKEIYNVNTKRIRLYLYCYANQNPDSLIQFWSKWLSVPENQFTKPYVRQDFDERKSQKMLWGLVHIRYSDTRLLSQIKSDIGIITSELYK